MKLLLQFVWLIAMLIMTVTVASHLWQLGGWYCLASAIAWIYALTCVAKIDEVLDL